MTGAFIRSSNPSRAFVTRRLAGETLIVPVTGGVADLECIYVLNPTAARIWDLLAAPVTVDGIAETIADEFEVSPDGAASDVSELLESLLAGGLIQSAEGA